MFSKALGIATQFTKPFILSRYTVGKECSSAVATCVIVNEDGWFLTAAHVLQFMKNTDDAVTEYLKRDEREAAIREADDIDKKERRKRLRALSRPSSDDPIGYSAWCGHDGVKVAEYAWTNQEVKEDIFSLENFLMELQQ